MTESVGIAFIGAGAVSQWHATAVHACSHSHLVGLYDTVTERAEMAAQTYGCSQYREIDELLTDSRVRAVAILSPVELHHQHTIQALAAGKHVLIEKPVATTISQLQEINDRARASNLVCMPAHNYIYAPALRQIRHLIETETFGRIVSAWIIYTLHHPSDIAIKYPGVVRQIMTHHFYSLLYLLGKPVRLAALAAEVRPTDEQLGREDQATMIMEMANGALVSLFASFAANDQTSDPWTVLYKVLGTEGGGQFSWRDTVRLGPGAGLSWRYPAYEQSFEYEVDYFVRECILGGKEPLSTISDAVVAQELVEVAEEAIRTGKVITV